MSSFTYRPPPLKNLPAEELANALDTAIPRLYDAHNTLRGIAIQGPALNAGYATNSGTLTITGSKTGITTGLAKVSAVTATINNGSVATNFTVTARPNPTNPALIDIYVWQPTSSSVTTATACTSPVLIHWTASGVNSLNAPSTS